MTKLDICALMTIRKRSELGESNLSIAQTLGVTEGTVRYHLKHPPGSRSNGRSKQLQKAASLSEVIEAWRRHQDEFDTGYNLTELHEHLVGHYDYTGSLRSIQRYWKRTYPQARIFTRRRIETPPGVQAQVDWGIYPTLIVRGVSSPQIRQPLHGQQSLVIF